MIGEPVTLAGAIAAAAARLTAAGIEESRREARLLVCRQLGVGPEQLLSHPERRLDAGDTARIEAAIARRAAREPVSRILGEREFWSLPFALNAATLDPRADSETLIGAVLAELGGRSAPLRLLDLGTGTGCLLLALLSELPQAEGLGIDASAEAVALAAENARRLGLAGRAGFRCHDWDAGLAPLGAAWDVILSNPPYIASEEIGELAPEVAAYDPRLALDGGPDGLAAYRSLVPAAAEVIAERGLIALEIGEGQASAVESLLRAAGFRPLRRARDLAGRERCLLAVWSGTTRIPGQERAVDK